MLRFMKAASSCCRIDVARADKRYVSSKVASECDVGCLI